MEALQGRVQDIGEELKYNLNWEIFKNVGLSTETYDFNAISDETNRPTERPTPYPTNRPTERPTPNPTRRPTMTPIREIVITFHPVQIILKNLPSGYSLSGQARDLIIRYFKEALERNLPNDYRMVDVTFEGYLTNGRDVSLPLRIAVEGPVSTSNFALSYVMDALQYGVQDIISGLKNLNFNIFKDVSLSTEMYDFNAITDRTNRPTRRPTPFPTRRPTPRPVFETVRTSHPLLLLIHNIPWEYSIQPATRVLIVRYVRELLADYLGNDLYLVDVTFEGHLINGRREGVLSVALRVDV
eukprot:CAMPEP_0183713930 /NCGR_PEP_ID=MMETSP0737-20130205/8657_1 /TAXON_ID=385413 /ORGANISM="Thalassiosira miniscula, Strain CCMP1093" /LENGTH=298 /DNA_ID=CAMNT_0025942811 /DNA_START=839 /DNA_END=1731 /DNA_ORIENTATION=+